MSKKREENTPKALAVFFWVVVGGLLGWQGNAVLADEPVLNIGSEAADIAEENVDLGLFWDVWGLLENDFIDIIDTTDEARVYGAISGMVDSLEDPYTAFMTPEESKSFSQSLNSELEGIGAELTVRDGLLVVVAPLKDSPAEEAGLLSGDHIYQVDGAPTSDMTLWDAIMNIRGEPGTEVILTVVREGEAETLDIPITRSKIHVPSIETVFEEVDGQNIAHVSLYSFADDTYLEFLDAIRAVQLADADGMVLDLRLNGGGFLDVSVEILGEFFEDEVKAVIVKHGDGTSEVIYTDGGGGLADIPVVVLIDGGSASASEIVAGALQDHERAVLMGETSFGKGSVQELTDLMGGASIRITVAKWFTPDDRTIDHEGIEPDVLIEVDTVPLDSEEDVQLQAALDYLSDLE
jgi:carboxyl-terminal processing protease